VDVADLITLAELKAALDVFDSSQDAKYTQAIAAASAAIRSFTGRNFAQADASGTRKYLYEGSGFLEIDDLDPTGPITVSLDGVQLVEGYDYLLMPDRGVMTPDAETAYYWIELVPSAPGSPEMGFTRNLDTLWWRVHHVHYIEVTGQFGWPAVPAEVKQAAIWTAGYFAESPRPYISVQVSDFSETVATNTENVEMPDRAKLLLMPYRRINV
jgi:hypothetical protein